MDIQPGRKTKAIAKTEINAGDSSPVTIKQFSAGWRISAVWMFHEIAWDNGATISVGKPAATDLLMPPTENAPSSTGSAWSVPDYVTVDGDILLATITGSPTVGKTLIVIEYE